MDFYSNYIALCNKMGISPSAAAERAGTTKTSVNRWKRGSIPSDATLQKLSDFFSCSIEELTGKGQKEAPAVQGDGRMMPEEFTARYWALSEAGRTALDQYARFLQQQEAAAKAKADPVGKASDK